MGEINFKDVNAGVELCKKLIEFSEYRSELFKKESEYNTYLCKAFTFLGSLDNYHMKLLVSLMLELVEAKGITPEELSVKIFAEDLDKLGWLCNFTPNEEEMSTTITLLPNPHLEEKNDET